MRRSKRNRKRNSPIPLLALQIAIFNAHPSRGHKDALASLRARIADAAHGVSYPVRERR
jgi:hypothetical protein